MRPTALPFRCRRSLILAASGLLTIADFFGPGAAALSAQENDLVPQVMPSVVGGVADEAGQDPNRINWNSAPPTRWIWGADADGVYVMSRRFKTELPFGWLRASCDNRMEIYLNGERVGESDTWQEPSLINVSKQLQAGDNTLTVKVRNDGGISGLVAQLALSQFDPTANGDRGAGDMQWVVTDESWKAVPNGRDSVSDATVVAKLGDGPWNNVFANASASSIRDEFVLLPGYQVERIYRVPRDEEGSWVAITIDPKGRIIASDQGDKGLYRITPGAVGTQEPARIEKLDVAMTSAQGLLYAFDSLYVSVNGGPGSGLYRLRDTTGDDQFDSVEKLAAFRGGGEHGPHALRLSPDGERIVVICGNHTDPPQSIDASRIPTNWSEDLLLPRQWDANGHARGRLAPGGWIASTNPEGTNWEILSVGYRNPYDMDFNADGELFAYDADMEWDLGTPWYRPTRVVHATSGSEFGWRSGTGKWPTWYEDSLPPAVDIGPGSPVGACFGYGLKFPGDYQRAFYICDWTFGTMYAIHLTPSGSTYVARKEEFLSRTPLPLTDVAVGPDGALYFTVGGRGTQSELYRVTYVGDQSTAAVDPRDAAGLEERAVRHELESFHRSDAPASALATIWKSLGSDDRFTRYAARVALEFQGVESWANLMTQETDPMTLVEATIALARQGSADHRDLALKALAGIDLNALSSDQRIAWYRALELVLIRLDGDSNAAPAEGEPEWDAISVALREKLDPHYPADDARENRELVQLLVRLGSESVVAKGVAILQQESTAAPPDLS
ncbi:MAG: heme-binding protein, partial [Planctomycetales bacterium]|nr:heme-binding protein [Planctomycetales bacterium]